MNAKLELDEDVMVHIRMTMGQTGRSLAEVLEATGVSGNLTTDAHLAALAIENGALLASCDADFEAFQANGLKWIDPLAEPG